jgi:hypothetical protein
MERVHPHSFNLFLGEKMEIIKGMPSTAEEAMEEVWSNKDQEEFLIEERLNEIEHELEMANDAHSEFLGQSSIMLKKVETNIEELKQERTKLKTHLRELEKKQ